MTIEIKVPNLPESVTSAVVATWHVKAGDPVKREQNLVDLETDKVMLEVPAVADGVLKEWKVQPGATVKAGDVLGVLAEGAATATPSGATKSEAPKPAAVAAAAAPASGDDSQSPAVRKLLAELGISAEGIPASGKGGRLTKEDVEAFAKAKKNGGGA